MIYEGVELKNDIEIQKLYTVHYFEYPKSFRSHSESYNFWGLVYVDKGEITVTTDECETVLSQGHVIFHQPDKWFSIKTDENIASSVTIVTFECNSENMDFFKNRILSVGQEQKVLLSKIISEYTNAFSTPLDDIFSGSLQRKPNPPQGSEQLLKQYLCEFLLLFLRRESPSIPHRPFSLDNSNSTLNILENYMLDNISTNISIEQLIKYSGLNRMSLNRLFKANYGISPIQYFIYLKIELAKKYLREDNYNISQISELLGYSSIHYFSLQFKKITGMSPSEYSASIKSMSPLDRTNVKFSIPKRRGDL